MIATQDTWYRLSSHDFPFYATREEVERFILELFHKEIEKYYICGTDSIKLLNERFYKEFSFYYKLEQIQQCFIEHPDNINFLIGRNDITSEKQLISLNSADAMHLSGLLCMQSILKPSGPQKRISASRICHNSKIITWNQDKIYEHTEYYNIFKRFKRAVKKTLPYKTIDLYTGVEDRRCLMSEGIMEQYKSGIVFDHQPLIMDKTIH
jgi:hypothetical protein